MDSGTAETVVFIKNITIVNHFITVIKLFANRLSHRFVLKMCTEYT
jgi:hypothetical protein